MVVEEDVEEEKEALKQCWPQTLAIVENDVDDEKEVI
jgi:hypothetical protein